MEAELGFQQGVLLSDYSTFGIGGPARFFCTVYSIEQLQAALAFASRKQIGYFVIGKGSNCLFDDRGFDGLIIFNRLDFTQKLGAGRFRVGSGASFALLGTRTARQGWSGLEFASGIPASVGGAICMNAGANGGDTSQCLFAVEWVRPDGALLILPREEMDFSYRTSPFQSMGGAIAAGHFQLKQDPKARARQIEIVSYRRKSQPYGEKSAGCIFRNPGDASAGALIEAAGLKGEVCGGAQVSLCHANFIINLGNATSSDVLTLIERVRARVKAWSGAELESEVKVVPYQFKAITSRGCHE